MVDHRSKYMPTNIEHGLVRILKMTSIKDIINSLLILCFFWVPLIIWKRHFHLFETMKECILASTVLISVGLLIISSIIHGKIEIRKSRLTLVVTLYYLYNVFSFFVFQYTETKYFFLFNCLVFLFFIVSSCADRHSRDRTLHTLLVVALLASIYAIFQFLGKDVFSFSHLYFGSVKIFCLEGSRAFAMFGHPNLLGGFCVCILPVMAAFLIRYRREKNLLMTLYVGSVFGLSCLAMVLSRTRSSWIASCIAMGFLLLICVRKHFLHLIKRYRFVIGAFIIICGVGVFAIFPLLRIFTSFTDMTSLKIRREYYKHTWKMIKDRPLFGRGIGTFEVYYPLYRDSRSAAQVGEPVIDFRIRHPHNEHLEILSDGGIIGYSLFFWLITEALRLLLTKRTLLEAGLAASIIGLLCDGLLTQNLRYIVISSLLWLIIGFSNISYTRTIVKNNSKSPLKGFRLTGVVIVILLTILSLGWVVRLTSAEYYIKGGLSAYSVRLYNTAILWWQEALSRGAEHKDVLYRLAQASTTVSERDQAIAYYEELLKKDPNFLQANFHLAELFLEKNNLTKAKYYFERQIAANTMHGKAYYRLAQIELNLGNEKQGKDYLIEIEKIHAIQPINSKFMREIREILSDDQEGEYVAFSYENGLKDFSDTFSIW